MIILFLYDCFMPLIEFKKLGSLNSYKPWVGF